MTRAAAAKTATMMPLVLQHDLIRAGLMNQRGRGLSDDGAKVFRRHAPELLQVGIAGRIDGNSAGEVEFADETPGGVQIFESSVAGGPTPGPNNPEGSAPDPVAAEVDDEVVLAARDDEGAEHLSAVVEARTQVCFLECGWQPVSPIQAAPLFPSVGPVT